MFNESEKNKVYQLAIEIIEKHIKPETRLHGYYMVHVVSVANKSLEIAALNRAKRIDLTKLYLSAMWHDIGICQVHAPEIGCFGSSPYLAHGYLGRQIIENEGYVEIAAVCERHIGVGLSREEVSQLKMDFPIREMMPVTNEEKIVCLADKYYSKTKNKLDIPKSYEEIIKTVSQYNKKKELLVLMKEFNIL